MQAQSAGLATPANARPLGPHLPCAKTAQDHQLALPERLAAGGQDGLDRVFRLHGGTTASLSDPLDDRCFPHAAPRLLTAVAAVHASVSPPPSVLREHRSLDTGPVCRAAGAREVWHQDAPPVPRWAWPPRLPPTPGGCAAWQDRRARVQHCTCSDEATILRCPSSAPACTHRCQSLEDPAEEVLSRKNSC